MCIQADEKINHDLGECPMFPQKENKSQHDWLGNYVVILASV